MNAWLQSTRGHVFYFSAPEFWILLSLFLDLYRLRVRWWNRTAWSWSKQQIFRPWPTVSCLCLPQPIKYLLLWGEVALGDTTYTAPSTNTRNRPQVFSTISFLLHSINHDLIFIFTTNISLWRVFQHYPQTKPTPVDKPWFFFEFLEFVIISLEFSGNWF